MTHGESATPQRFIAYRYFAIKVALIVSGIWIGIVTGGEHWVLLTIFGAVI